MTTLVDRKTAMRVSTTRMTQVLTLVSVVLMFGCWIFWLARRVSLSLEFDDAYMFYRYALHLRQGLGMSWNIDGVHTYGETSLGWGLVVLVLSYLPLSMSTALVMGSWLSSVGAVVAISWAVARNAKSEYMSSTWRVLPMVAVPLLFTFPFRTNAVTGMETMLATLLCGVFGGLVLRWAEGRVRPEVAGLVGTLLFLVRPEMAMVVVLMPCLAHLLLPGSTKKGLATLLGLFAACFALDLVVCRLYFGTALPLSFYMKTHGYAGYHATWFPGTAALAMLWACAPYFALLALFGQVSDLRRSIVCLVPAAATFAYLLTVVQIMSVGSRYYLPCTALFVLPGLLALDRRMGGDSAHEGPFWPVRRAVAVVGGTAVICLLLWFVNARLIKLGPLMAAVDRRIEHRYFAYDPVHFQVSATQRLPRHYWPWEMKEMATVLLKPLPKGTTIAASEVGYLGAAVPEVNIIDLAGLNDTQIALHGFDVGALLARKPDIIWMPHFDYTYQRGVMLSNAKLLEQYDVIAGAFGYDIALRKDSAVRPAIDTQMRVVWKDLYVGYRMEDYLVQSASWSGQKHIASAVEEENIEAEKDQLETVSQRQE